MTHLLLDWLISPGIALAGLLSPGALPADAALLAASPPALAAFGDKEVCKLETEICSNFNGTAIPAGRTVWFNAVAKIVRPQNQPAVILVGRSIVTFTVGGTPQKVLIPPTRIEFSATATQAATTFNAGLNRWETVVPASYTGNVFVSGTPLAVTTALPGGINPVCWSSVVASDTLGVEFRWKWAAAVYTTFATDYNDICVKPIDGSSQNPYPNSHHAGTPECFLPFVVGGARGGGGSNFTGSYSGTETVRCE